VPGLTPSSRWEVQAARKELSDEPFPADSSSKKRLGFNVSARKTLRNIFLKYVVKQLTAEQNIMNTHKRAYKHAEVKGKGKYLANKQII
jgi:hypothetical protein